jgi:predicted O-methyltransferase YrrM
MFDFIYVDGSHYAGDALTDILYAWHLLKYNGLMIMDDYVWGKEQDTQVTRMAIDSFLKCFRGEYEVLARSAQCVIKKSRLSV